MRSAAAAGAWRDHDWRGHDHAWCCYDSWSAIVHTAVVTIATTAAVGTTMKARSTTAGDRNCQAGLCLFEWRERHCLGAGNAKETDDYCCREMKNFVHSFLLLFVRYILAPDVLASSMRFIRA